jgi:hypothetical protein
MSDSDMLEAAEAEVERLERELEATPAYQKLQLARKVVDLYRSTPDARYIGEHAANFGRPKSNPLQSITTAGAETKTRRIEIAGVKYLDAKGKRAPASELLGAMLKAGIEIGGAEPVKALSAYLSNSKALNNVREYGGYGLVEWGNNPGPDLLTKTGA